MRAARRILRFMLDSALILTVGAVASAALVSFTPGSELDERELNPQYSAESIAKLRAEREKAHSLLFGSVGFFKATLRGDFGVSESSGLPVSDLLRERVPVTLRTVGA